MRRFVCSLAKSIGPITSTGQLSLNVIAFNVRLRRGRGTKGKERERLSMGSPLHFALSTPISTAWLYTSTTFP